MFYVKYAEEHMDNNLTSLIMKPCSDYVLYIDIYIYACVYLIMTMSWVLFYGDVT